MVTREPLYCLICNSSLSEGENLEQHLASEHKALELAKELATEWEADQLGEET